MNIDKALQNKIDNIMCWFEFDKVETMMQSVDWEWHIIGVPDKGEIKEEALRLLRHVSAEIAKGATYYRVATGGFSAEAEIYDDGDEKWLDMRLDWGLEWQTEPQIITDDKKENT